MSPSGAVEINGERLDARSDAGPIEAGSQIVVVRGDSLGFVVGKVELGKPLPPLPGQGELIATPEHRQNADEVAAADKQERATEVRTSRRRLRPGILAAGSLGAMVGLVSGAVGWFAGWVGNTDAATLAWLLGCSLTIGLVAGVVLFFLTGVVGALQGFLSEGEAELTPNFFAIAAALVGASVGFWRQYGAGDTSTIALWSVGGAGVFALAMYVLGWLLGKVQDAAVGAG
jgi:hypothetical protein